MVAANQSCCTYLYQPPI
ncbi:MAG: cyclic lactone autoinducer peptide [Methylococcales bacterium]|nr:cyclic lactone autoinducer peptide [Methylococcales bacterium]